ncbi:MAG: hypothetical protein WDN49_16540 [Acetobacteraceae bacterium]
MGIGLFSPPFGVGFYQTCLIGKVSSDEAFGRIWPYNGDAGRGADHRRRSALDFHRLFGVAAGQGGREGQGAALDPPKAVGRWKP